MTGWASDSSSSWPWSTESDSSSWWDVTSRCTAPSEVLRPGTRTIQGRLVIHVKIEISTYTFVSQNNNLPIFITLWLNKVLLFLDKKWKWFRICAFLQDCKTDGSSRFHRFHLLVSHRILCIDILLWSSSYLSRSSKFNFFTSSKIECPSMDLREINT